ncbi:virulence factor TspB C-terminal domain-related protein [Chromobacterium violaceum]|uniref:Neisseria meningitidis TspB protein n=3 Tax=Chromobacterium violaceum TaxID=536 RepID=A0AAX2M762_CHRVL|nr:virulence factor TspB C-terminal domain-related protein [Chromobacterium violaceum]STB63795.1 Neisseria meningitidis TspB protein [Chromobacterium violaceum]SUX32418.1 Neisseria meningitidis TspB protein [Chromobacterium violaceum]
MTTPPILFLAALFGLFIPSAQAGDYQIGTYHQAGDQITRTAPRQQSSTLLSQILNAKLLDDIVNQHDKSVSVSQDVKYRIGGASGTLHDTYRIPAKPLAKRLGEAMKRNARGGVAGMIGGTAASLAVDYAIDQGWKWMDEMRRYMKTTPDDYDDVKRNEYGRYDQPGYRVNCRSFSKAKTLSECFEMEKAHYKGPYTLYMYQISPPGRFPADIGLYEKIKETDSHYMGVLATIDRVDGGPGSPGSPNHTQTPVTDADIDKAADDLLKNKTLKVIDAFARDGTILDLDDGTAASVSGDSVTGPKSITGSGTETRPDGSTVATQTQSQTTYTPRGGGVLSSPIGFEQTTTSTTTINNCTGAGSCSTSTSTSTTNKPPPSEPQQTDCDKYPDIIGCSKYGDPPSVPIPEQERELKFTPKSFAMPATCPPNYEFTLSSGQHFSYSFEWFCKFASAIRALIILAALISAYFIIFSARKGEGS